MSAMIRGSATGQGTAGYAGRFASRAPEHYRRLGGLEVSSVGIGTYLGVDDDAMDDGYVDAVSRALALGLNVVDTAVNYRHQRSERAVGRALASAVASSAVGRDEVVVATKGGFIAFDSAVPDDPGAYFRDTYLRTGIIRPGEVTGGSHCMAPRFLADQIDRSRTNLGLDTIDVYYLHNPETALGEVDRAEFLRRLRAAFEALESSVARGKIGCYGTATWNGYRVDPADQGYLSLAEVVGVAREIGGADHHMRVIQLPYNLAMPEAFTKANQVVEGETVPALEAARRLGIYVMASASVYQGQLARNLPRVVADYLPGLQTDAQRALQFVRSTPGIGTALVGMASRRHVEENAAVAGVPPIAWEAFKRLFSPA